MTVIVYEPDGSALFNYKRPAITSNDGWNAGGLKVEVVEPTERIRTTIRGLGGLPRRPALDVRSGQGLQGEPAQEAEARPPAPRVRPALRATSAKAGRRQRLRARALRATHARRRHAVGRRRRRGEARGTRTARPLVGGRATAQSTPSYRWITGNFGDDLGMVISVIGGKPGGVMHKGDHLHRITDVKLDTDYEADSKFHSARCAPS